MFEANLWIIGSHRDAQSFRFEHRINIFARRDRSPMPAPSGKATVALQASGKEQQSFFFKHLAVVHLLMVGVTKLNRKGTFAPWVS